MYNSNPYGYNMYTPQPVTPMPQKREIDRVMGREGAEMYRMAPDSAVLLLDERDPIVWFVRTDSAGYKSIIPYDITPHEEKKAPDVGDIDARMNAFDERLKAIEEALK